MQGGWLSGGGGKATDRRAADTQQGARERVGAAGARGGGEGGAGERGGEQRRRRAGKRRSTVSFVDCCAMPRADRAKRSTQALKRTLREVVEARDEAEARERAQRQRVQELDRELRQLRLAVCRRSASVSGTSGATQAAGKADMQVRGGGGRAELASREAALRMAREKDQRDDKMQQILEQLQQLDGISSGVQELLDGCVRAVTDVQAGTQDAGKGVRDRLVRLSAVQLAGELREQ
eukprot:1487344-Rhodomonas_salina.1